LTLLDRDDRYGNISRFNHWLGAAAVRVMFALGLYFSGLPRGDARGFWLGLHISPGVEQHASRQCLTAAVHHPMLLAVGTLILTGPFIVWTPGRPLEGLDGFALPSPLPKLEHPQEGLEGAQVTAACTLMGLVAVNGDGAVRRMWGRNPR